MGATTNDGATVSAPPAAVKSRAMLWQRAAAPGLLFLVAGDHRVARAELASTFCGGPWQDVYRVAGLVDDDDGENARQDSKEV